MQRIAWLFFLSNIHTILKLLLDSSKLCFGSIYEINYKSNYLKHPRHNFSFFIFETIATFSYSESKNSKAMHANYAKNLKIFHPTKDLNILKSDYFPTSYYVQFDTNMKILAKKPDQEIRLFSYGGSTVAGSPFGGFASFSSRIDKFFKNQNSAKSGKTLEVFNLGVSSIGSSKALRLFELSIPYKPDIAIFYLGHNEIYDYRDLHKTSPKKRISQYLREYSNLFKFLYNKLEDYNTIEKAEELIPYFEEADQNLSQQDILNMGVLLLL